MAATTNDAKEMTRRLAREEGLFAGISSDVNVVAAMLLAERLGPEKKIVTLMVDSGAKIFEYGCLKKVVSCLLRKTIELP